jgi:hypothetical protein
VPGPEELSREELLALLAVREASEADKDARIDALLVMVGELTAQVQALVLKAGQGLLELLQASLVGRAGPPPAGWVVAQGVRAKAR